MSLRFVQLIGLATVLVFVAGSPGASGTVDALPLIGVNFSNFGPAACGDGGWGIVAYGNLDSGALRQELAAMRAAGIQSLRTFIWSTHDPGSQTWGIVGSAGGRLDPTETKNLTQFVSEVRRLEFTRLEVAFAPGEANDPVGYPQNTYNPSLFDENWQLIRYVRGIVKQYGGPLETRFDLFNEGAPSDYLATKTQVEEYLAQMYSNYVDAFGNSDVTVSSIVGANDQSRIANLIDTLRSTGRPLPTWFEVHAYSTNVLADLRATDATMTAKGLSQPITLGETYYNDPLAASAVQTFVTTSARRLDEVLEWPLQRGSTCSNWSVQAPYRADAFITALTGAQPPHAITVALDPGRAPVLKTPYGQPVTALEAGTYSVAITDRSRTDNFHLTGPTVNRATGRRFRGNKAWTIRLKPGTYRYRSDRPNSHLKGSFAVLKAG
jgi:hypothetical protein